MRIDVITIFPAMVRDFAGASLLGKAQERGLLDLRVHDPRDVTTDVHRTVDDAPFGGGAGMVLTPGPLFDIVEREQPPRPLFLLGPGGRTLDQPLARALAALDGFSLLCGRYEGVDDRVRSHLVDGEISISATCAPKRNATPFSRARVSSACARRTMPPSTAQTPACSTCAININVAGA